MTFQLKEDKTVNAVQKIWIVAIDATATMTFQLKQGIGEVPGRDEVLALGTRIITF